MCYSILMCVYGWNCARLDRHVTWFTIPSLMTRAGLRLLVVLCVRRKSSADSRCKRSIRRKWAEPKRMWRKIEEKIKHPCSISRGAPVYRRSTAFVGMNRRNSRQTATLMRPDGWWKRFPFHSRVLILRQSSNSFPRFLTNVRETNPIFWFTLKSTKCKPSIYIYDSGMNTHSDILDTSTTLVDS